MFEEERLKKIIGDLNKLRLENPIEVKEILIKKGDYKTPDEAGTEGFVPFKNGDYWGGDDGRFWFRSQVLIPEVYVDRTVIMKLRTGKEGEWDALNPQFLLFINGQLIQGLDVNHTEVVLTKEAASGDCFTLDFHAFAGMQAQPVKFNLEVAVLDEVTEGLIYDLKVPYETLLLLEEDDVNHVNVASHLMNALNMLNLSSRNKNEQYFNSVELTRKYLKEELYNNVEMVRILKSKNLLPTVSCIGHSHIDVAWLWTLKQTREKAVRSFSTVLKLMEDYPEYLFMASQPILLEFIREDYPELFEKIKAYVKKGQFEIEGGMWLEADCNLSSGESLVRHILYGKKYMRDHFDVNSEVLWLPDVFGYSAALPQILKQFGIRTFVTTKISWNEYNQMPYDTFNWRGLDGSEVLSYFMTMMNYDAYKSGSFKTVYEGVIEPSQIKGAWARYQQKSLNTNVLVSYGYGDGGGGPTKDMLESARRMHDYIPGLPHLEHSTVKDYFNGLHKRLETIPTWVGELYLEYHRGTLTNMGQSKWYNRKSEYLYQNLESLNTLVTSQTGCDYQGEMIRSGWDVILLNQFHDIIPGTSIKEVYDESFEQYENILKDGKSLQTKLMKQLSDEILKVKDDAAVSLVVYNPLSVQSEQIMTFEVEHDYDVYFGDQLILSQYEDQTISFMDELPSKGYKVYKLVKKEVKTKETMTTRAFSTDYYEIKFDQLGHIVSIYDKQAQREVVSKNQKVNELILYEDRPHNWDAWDVNIYYEEKPLNLSNLVSFNVCEDGELYTKVEIRRAFGQSTINQNIYLYKHHRRIDFKTTVDWHEQHMFLKAVFPVDVFSSTATYDMQFGVIERPTHRNTSWDEAKFEVCGHKWADLSEKNYGVSLMSDSKYGYDVHDHVMRLSLLRGSVYPNPEADQGVHHFEYSLLPHLGDWSSNTYKEGYLFNVKPIGHVTYGKRLEATSDHQNSFVLVDVDNVIVDTIKLAENKDGTIVRVFETTGIRSKVKMVFLKGYQAVTEVNLEEETINVCEIIDHTLEFTIKPFEIKTFRLK